MAKERIILGIDPGTTIMGFGIIKVVGNEMYFVQLNELLLQKYADPYTKLKLIFERTISLIDTYHPDEIAIEAPFFGKNVQSMLKLGRAQGVAMAAGLSREIPITEYSPKKVKQSVTGNGNASKEQVAAMLQTILKFKEMPEWIGYWQVPSGFGLWGQKPNYLGNHMIIKDPDYSTNLV